MARYAPVLTVAGAMTLLGVWGLARASAMGNDETVSRYVALLPLRQLWHLLRRVDAVHGLYYLLLHGWMAVGTSPAVMRIPSVAAMVAAAALMVVIARRLTGSGWGGLIAGLIMALTPTISYYAQTARSYALVYTCVLGQTLTLLSALEAERPGPARARVTRWWALYAALVTLGVYLNEMALLVLAAHAITVLLARYGRRAVRHWLAASAVGAVLAIPLLWLSYLQRSAISWIQPPGPHALWLLYHDYFGSAFAVAPLVVACSVVAVLPSGRWWRRRNGGTDAASAPAWWRGGGVSVPSVALPLLLVPAGLLLVESRIAPPMYQDRYVLYGEAGAALLAGGGLYRMGRWLAAATRRPELALLPGLAVCLCTLFAQLGVQYHDRLPASRDFNYAGPAFYVAAHAHSGDGVLFLDSYYRKAELGYPEQFRKTSDFLLAVPPATTASYNGINKPLAAIRPLMLDHRRIWTIGSRPSVHLPGLAREESLILLHDFTQVTVRSYKGLWLTLWIRHDHQRPVWIRHDHDRGPEPRIVAD